MEPSAPNAVLHHPESGYIGRLESAVSGVTWSAVAGGAFVAAAMALILLAFGTGLGLSSVSPWANTGASAAAVGIATVMWMVLMQLISSAMGGYVAGRLRTKWVDVRDDEVFFRDTAHGFLVWAVGLVISAAFLGSAASSLVGAAAEVIGGTVATGTVAAGVAAREANGRADAGAARPDGSAGEEPAYFVDALFRLERPPVAGAAAGGSAAPETSAAPSSPTPGAGPAPGATQSATPAGAPATGTDTARTYWATEEGGRNAPFMRGADTATRMEAARILAHGLTQDQFPQADRSYLVQLVSARTGMSAAEADRRVSSVLANAQQAKMRALEKADEARRAAAHLAFWTFFALLAGAFAASFAATIGGRQRDAAALRR
jgi:hypothetical protein